MAEDREQSDDLQDILAQLLDFQEGQGPEQGNILVLLSLVNLLGIVNILKGKMQNSQASPEFEHGSTPNPQSTNNLLSLLTGLMGGGKNLAGLAPLLSMLGGQGNQSRDSNIDLAGLLKLFNQFMGQSSLPANAGPKPAAGMETGMVENSGEESENAPVKEPEQPVREEDVPDNKSRIVVKKNRG